MPLVMMVVVIVLITVAYLHFHQGQTHCADGGVAGPVGHRVQQRVTHAGALEAHHHPG